MSDSANKRQGRRNLRLALLLGGLALAFYVTFALLKLAEAGA